MTFTEMTVTALIWILTACGAFFGIRAKLKKRAERKRNH